MKLKILFTAIFLSIGFGLMAQNLACGILQDTSQQFHFCRVNATNGQTIFNNPLPTVTNPVSFTSILDFANNQYVLKVNYPNSRYYSIDITSGNVVTDAPALDDIRMLEIHPYTGVVYGLLYDSVGVYHFVSVDVHTGVMTYMSLLTGITTITAETSVINPLTNQYIFAGNSPNIQYYTIDISTGVIVNTVPAQDQIVCLRIHSVTGIIYGLWVENNINWHFVSVDNLSGQHTVISSPSGISTVSLTTSFLNPVTNQYIFRVNYPVQRYYHLNLATGALITDTPSVQNVVFLEWCGFLTNINKKEDLFALKIAPNPFDDFTILRVCNPNDEKLTISISDISGRTHLIKEDEGIHEVTIDRYQLGLKSGIYLVIISKNDLPVSQSKIIVQ